MQIIPHCRQWLSTSSLTAASSTRVLKLTGAVTHPWPLVLPKMGLGMQLEVVFQKTEGMPKSLPGVKRQSWAQLLEAGPKPQVASSCVCRSPIWPVEKHSPGMNQTAGMASAEPLSLPQGHLQVEISGLLDDQPLHPATFQKQQSKACLPRRKGPLAPSHMCCWLHGKAEILFVGWS